MGGGPGAPSTSLRWPHWEACSRRGGLGGSHQEPTSGSRRERLHSGTSLSPQKQKGKKLGKQHPVAKESHKPPKAPGCPPLIGLGAPPWSRTSGARHQLSTQEGCSRTHGQLPECRTTEGRKRCKVSKIQRHKAQERTPRLRRWAPQMSVGRENPPALCARARVVGSLAV